MFSQWNTLYIILKLIVLENSSSITESATVDEVNKTIVKMKNRKAPGHGLITTEMIKYMGYQG